MINQKMLKVGSTVIKGFLFSWQLPAESKTKDVSLPHIVSLIIEYRVQ